MTKIMEKLIHFLRQLKGCKNCSLGLGLQQGKGPSWTRQGAMSKGEREERARPTGLKMGN